MCFTSCQISDGTQFEEVGKERFWFYVVIVEMVVKHIEVLQLFSFFWSSFFAVNGDALFILHLVDGISLYLYLRK